MRNLSRRLERLEAAIPEPEGEEAVKCRELIECLSCEEIDSLRVALGSFADDAATEEDYENIQSILMLAQERFEAGLIIIRERKSPAQWNAEMRGSLRLQRETGHPWQSTGYYNEFLVEAAALKED